MKRYLSGVWGEKHMQWLSPSILLLWDIDDIAMMYMYMTYYDVDYYIIWLHFFQWWYMYSYFDCIMWCLWDPVSSQLLVVSDGFIQSMSDSFSESTFPDVVHISQTISMRCICYIYSMHVGYSFK